MTIKLAIVGAGRWGINHVRTAFELLGTDLKTVCDSSDESRRRVLEMAPGTQVVDDPEDLLRATDIDAVVVATPAETHFEIAMRFLKAGKHCLVEKPIALSVSEAEELVGVADSLDRVLMVGHVLLYHPAVLEMKRRISQGIIGTIQYIYSNRLNLGTVRSEENILWSFAPHDIAIIQYLVGSNPISVNATGAIFLQKGIEDITITNLSYRDNIHAHIFVSWLHPFKEQRLVVIGHKGMLVFEDTLAENKLRFFPKGFDAIEGRLEKFDGEFLAIPYSPEEPLAAEHRHFYECVQTGRRPVTDGSHAVDVLRILQEAQMRLTAT